jgi:hypothetical protein
MIALIPPIRRRIGLATLNRPACQGLLVLGAWLFLGMGIAGPFLAAIGIGVFEVFERYRRVRRAQLPGRPWWV